MNSVWYGLTDENKLVYHYTKAATLLDYILPKTRLLLSRFQNVNDPRESKDWVFGIQSTNWDLDFDIDTVRLAFNRYLKHEWHVGCFVSDVPEALTTRAREAAGGDMLAALYERGHSRPRMWAQYGDGYKGACLVFSKSELDAAIRTAAGGTAMVHAAHVTYRNPPVGLSLREPNALMIDFDEVLKSGIEQAARLHAKRYFCDILFLKSRDWESEREFRWAVTETAKGELFVDIKSSLKGIMVGDLCPNLCRRAIGEYALLHDVEVAQMGWRNGVPQPEGSHPRIFANLPLCD